MQFWPTILAAKQGNNDIVELLLDKGWIPIQLDGLFQPRSKNRETNMGTCIHSEPDILGTYLRPGIRSTNPDYTRNEKEAYTTENLSEDQAIAKFYTEHLPAIVNKTIQVYHNFSDYFQSALNEQLTVVTY